MPRILFVTQYHYLRRTGGAELQCWMLARELSRRGWDVHYVSENNRPDAPRELDGISLHYVSEESPWYDANRAAVAKIIRDLNPDVLYNRVYNLYTSHTMRFAPAHTVTIWASAAQHDGQVTSTLGELWQTKSLKQYLVLVPRTILIRLKARAGALKAKLVLAQSRDQISMLQERGFKPELLRNSIVESGQATPQSHDGKPVVLWAGSVKKWKRPELFFQLARRCADLDCEFVMAGELQDELSKVPLERAARELPQFRYVGFVPPEQIGKLYDRAHLFVSTSRAEGFANTFIQAWLRGIPVVSLDVDPDGLLSAEGLGAAAHSIDELEQKLRAFIQDVTLRRTVGAHAREFALREFDLVSNVNRLEALIQSRQ
ncbi:MAG: glycosyltransferase family 4 protein [bacterium]|nr:glycosyltransferase family 4 protein [bacterium]